MKNIFCCFFGLSLVLATHMFSQTLHASAIILKTQEPADKLIFDEISFHQDPTLHSILFLSDLEQSSKVDENFIKQALINFISGREPGISLGEKISRYFAGKNIISGIFPSSGRFKTTAHKALPQRFQDLIEPKQKVSWFSKPDRQNWLLMELDNSKELPLTENSFDRIVMRHGLCACSPNTEKSCGGLLLDKGSIRIFFESMSKLLSEHPQATAFLEGGYLGKAFPASVKATKLWEQVSDEIAPSLKKKGIHTANLYYRGSFVMVIFSRIEDVRTLFQGARKARARN